MGQVRAAGFRVEPIPGASAVVAALSASGVDSNGFSFLGFPPIRGNDRKIWFGELALEVDQRAVVFYEAPHRIAKTLEEIDKFVKRPIIVFRELTKVHEEFVEGIPSVLSARFSDAHGEFTVIVPPTPAGSRVVATPSDSVVLNKFGELTKNTIFSSKKDAARAVAMHLGLSTRAVYDILERNK